MVLPPISTAAATSRLLLFNTTITGRSPGLRALGPSRPESWAPRAKATKTTKPLTIIISEPRSGRRAGHPSQALQSRLAAALPAWTSWTSCTQARMHPACRQLALNWPLQSASLLRHKDASKRVPTSSILSIGMVILSKHDHRKYFVGRDQLPLKPDWHCSMTCGRGHPIGLPSLQTPGERIILAGANSVAHRLQQNRTSSTVLKTRAA